MLYTCDEPFFFLVSKFSKKIKEKEATKNQIEKSKSYISNKTIKE